jgi:dihydrofolate synthase/folylpolyglutamate synthase
MAWLDAHTNFEAALPGRAALPTLDRIEELVDVLGHPERAYPVVHVTGTNGKGSTVRIVSALLEGHGLRVGAYISPDLSRVNERIALDGEPIPDDELVSVLAELAAIEGMLERRPTRFELLTAAAFAWFAERAVDVAVVEVGLGGRFDATNVVEPAVAVVTNVSDDHLDVLGPTVLHVAAEKAGILKPGSAAVLGAREPEVLGVLLDAARRAGTEPPLVVGEHFDCEANRVAVGGRLVDLRTPRGRYDEVYLSLHGAHQGENAAVAIAATEAFFARALDERIVRHALGSVRVPGRLEVLGRRPLVVLDGAHNPAGARALAVSLREEFRVEGRRVMVAGMLAGRDPEAFFSAFAPDELDLVVACPARSPRGQSPAVLAAAASACGLRSLQAPSLEAALAMALDAAGDDGMAVVSGSLYVVGEARERLTGAPQGDHG